MRRELLHEAGHAVKHRDDVLGCPSAVDLRFHHHHAVDRCTVPWLRQHPALMFDRVPALNQRI